MQDSLRAVIDTVFAQAAFDWRPRADPFALLRRGWAAFLNWLVDLREAWPTAFDVAFWLAAAGVVLLVARAAWITTRGFRATPDAGTGPAGPRAKDAAWYRLEADRLARAGSVVEAMQADFTALVLELDARRIVRFHPSKTPREYVREAAVGADARRELGDLVWSLYRHAFAREPVTSHTWQEWRARTGGDRYAPAG